MRLFVLNQKNYFLYTISNILRYFLGLSYFDFYDNKFYYLRSFLSLEKDQTVILERLQKLQYKPFTIFIPELMNWPKKIQDKEILINDVNKLNLLLANFIKSKSEFCKNDLLTLRLLYDFYGRNLGRNGYFVLSSKLYNFYSNVMLENEDKFINKPLNSLRLKIGHDKYYDYFDFNSKENIGVNSIFEVYRSIFSKYKTKYSLVQKAYSFNSIDFDFMTKLKNKTVTLVAPGSLLPEDLETISSSEVIVFLNYRGLDSTYSDIKESVQGKTLISYYSGARDKQFDLLSCHTFVNELDFSVWSNKKVHTINRMLEPNKIRGLRNHNVILEHGRLHFALYAIIDLLMFELNELHLTGVDFFLSKGVYSKSYASSDPVKSLKGRWETLSHHNQFSQFNIIKHLVSVNKLNINSNLMRIISLDSKDYAKKIEKFYPRA